MLLAMDTSTGTVCAAVHRDGVVLAEGSETDPRRHAELLAPVVDRVLRQAGATVRELTGVVVGVGPGPFTGLRVGVVTALVLARAVGLRAHGVCSLDVLAHQVTTGGHCAPEGEFLVATDARRKEVYWARYAARSGSAQRLEGPDVARAGDLPPGLRALPSFGRGPVLYPEHLRDAGGPRDVAAGALADLAAGPVARIGVESLVSEDGLLLPPEPLYLRRPDAALPGPPKLVHQPDGGGR